MKAVFRQTALALSVLTLCAATMAAVSVDRRVVDSVLAGNPESEMNHGFVADNATAGTAHGKTFRQARGWMRYAMTTFDDTEVTLACTFVSTDNASYGYDVLVEDSLITSRRFSAPTGSPPPAFTVVEIAVPFVLTKGKTNIAIIVRARDGSTPALQELRTVQNHNEFE